MKIKANKKQILSICLVVLGSFVLANYAHAGVGDFIAEALSWMVYGIIWVLGKLLMLVMWGLIAVAQYNNFINAQPIQYGWTIVRDVCNMFFILILLIIAFATILQVEQYSFKKLLPKLILMAILINFSKLICGVFIDFTQVIMLTFVNGFKDVGEGNLSNMLGIENLMNMSDTTTSEEVSSWTILGTYMLALMYTIIALITVIMMLATLCIRIIMIWIYVVLSPLAYLLASFPAGQKYSAQWWEEFSKNLIVGPILAFFTWLSFVSLGGVSNPDVQYIVDKGEAGGEGVFEDASSNAPSVGLTQAGSTEHMMKFAISISMLIGGLMVSQQLGSQAGGMAKKGIGRLQAMGARPLRAAGRAAGRLGKRAAVSTGRGALGVAKFVGGTADRLGGKAVDAGIRKATGGKYGTADKPVFGGKGFVGTSTAAVRNFPGNMKAYIQKRVVRDKDLNEKRRDVSRKADGEIKQDGRTYKYDTNTKGYVEKTATGNDVHAMNWQNTNKNYSLNHNGKDYQYDKQTDKFHELDANGQVKKNGEILKHNNKDLTSKEFKDFAEVNSDAAVKVNNKAYKYDKNAGDFVDSNNDKLSANAVAQKTGAIEKSVLTNKAGKKVTQMTAVGESFRDAWKSSFGAASAAKNKAQEEKVTKEQEKIAASGMSDGDMLRNLNDATTSNTKKMALAMTLAVKEGFKSKSDVNQAKNALKGNPLLLKQFNDTVDSKQAHLNYDLTNSADRNTFKNRIESGKINMTQMKSYDADTMSAIKEYSGQDFGRVVKTIYDRGSKYEKPVSDALLANRKMNPAGQVDADDTYAKQHAKLTGNVMESFKDKQGPGINVAALSNYLKEAKAGDLNKMDAKVVLNTIQNGNQITPLKTAIGQGIDYVKIKSMLKQGDNPDLVRQLLPILMNYSKQTDIDKIRNDNELNSLI